MRREFLTRLGPSVQPPQLCPGQPGPHRLWEQEEIGWVGWGECAAPQPGSFASSPAAPSPHRFRSGRDLGLNHAGFR